jgi:hypothetical protein
MVTEMETKAMPAMVTAKSYHCVVSPLLWLTALLSVYLCITYLLTLRQSIGGVDFYFYVLNARDLAEPDSSAPWARYIYFPGVYRFWEIVFRISDGTLASLQWTYLGVLLANAGLVAAILSASVRSWPGGLLGSAAYIVLAGRLEGLSGCTEPIATIPFLFGLLSWYLFEQKRFKKSGLTCLSFACGICLFVKQQAVLLVLGVTALLIVPSPSSRHLLDRFSEIVIVVIGTCMTFLLAMWLDGGGYSALKTGLAFAVGYRAQGSWVSHATGLWQVSQPLSAAFLCAIVVWVVSLFLPAIRTGDSSTGLRLLGITILSTIAGVFQFSRRGYLHYGLLILPSALLSVAVALRLGLTAIRPLAIQWSTMQRRLAITLAVIALSWLVVPATDSAIQEITRQVTSAGSSRQKSSAQFTALCSHLQPGSFLLVIPPRHNDLHWACHTKTIGTPLGYGWENLQLSDYLGALNDSHINQVLVFESRAEEGARPSADATPVINHLLDAGFHQSAQYEDATLYKLSDTR